VPGRLISIFGVALGAAIAVSYYTLSFRMGTPVRLFARTGGNQGVGYATSLDDQRFLMIEKSEANQSSQLNLVQNWFEELKARVPPK
jgi:hypothetical protein